ncbi:hypothetical protein JTB14_034398 [Gonioctena quinquepunctata]|nr:hypothetical protein JTB14_034398 [Gonioctena quinquepunctata]
MPVARVPRIFFVLLVLFSVFDGGATADVSNLSPEKDITPITQVDAKNLDGHVELSTLDLLPTSTPYREHTTHRTRDFVKWPSRNATPNNDYNSRTNRPSSITESIEIPLKEVEKDGTLMGTSRSNVAVVQKDIDSSGILKDVAGEGNEDTVDVTSELEQNDQEQLFKKTTRETDDSLFELGNAAESDLFNIDEGDKPKMNESPFEKVTISLPKSFYAKDVIAKSDDSHPSHKLDMSNTRYSELFHKGTHYERKVEDTTITPTDIGTSTTNTVIADPKEENHENLHSNKNSTDLNLITRSRHQYLQLNSTDSHSVTTEPKGILRWHQYSHIEPEASYSVLPTEIPAIDIHNSTEVSSVAAEGNETFRRYHYPHLKPKATTTSITLSTEATAPPTESSLDNTSLFSKAPSTETEEHPVVVREHHLLHMRPELSIAVPLTESPLNKIFLSPTYVPTKATEHLAVVPEHHYLHVRPMPSIVVPSTESPPNKTSISTIALSIEATEKAVVHDNHYFHMEHQPYIAVHPTESHLVETYVSPTALSTEATEQLAVVRDHHNLHMGPKPSITVPSPENNLNKTDSVRKDHKIWYGSNIGVTVAEARKSFEEINAEKDLQNGNEYEEKSITVPHSDINENYGTTTEAIVFPGEIEEEYEEELVTVEPAHWYTIGPVIDEDAGEDIVTVDVAHWNGIDPIADNNNETMEGSGETITLFLGDQEGASETSIPENSHVENDATIVPVELITEIVGTYSTPTIETSTFEKVTDSQGSEGKATTHRRNDSDRTTPFSQSTTHKEAVTESAVSSAEIRFEDNHQETTTDSLNLPSTESDSYTDSKESSKGNVFSPTIFTRMVENDATIVPVDLTTELFGTYSTPTIETSTFEKVTDSQGSEEKATTHRRNNFDRTTTFSLSNPLKEAVTESVVTSAEIRFEDNHQETTADSLDLPSTESDSYTDSKKSSKGNVFSMKNQRRRENNEKATDASNSSTVLETPGEDPSTITEEVSKENATSAPKQGGTWKPTVHRKQFPGRRNTISSVSDTDKKPAPENSITNVIDSQEGHKESRRKFLDGTTTVHPLHNTKGELNSQEETVTNSISSSAEATPDADKYSSDHFKLLESTTTESVNMDNSNHDEKSEEEIVTAESWYKKAIVSPGDIEEKYEEELVTVDPPHWYEIGPVIDEEVGEDEEAEKEDIVIVDHWYRIGPIADKDNETMKGSGETTLFSGGQEGASETSSPENSHVSEILTSTNHTELVTEQIGGIQSTTGKSEENKNISLNNNKSQEKGVTVEVDEIETTKESQSRNQSYKETKNINSQFNETEITNMKAPFLSSEATRGENIVERVEKSLETIATSSASNVSSVSMKTVTDIPSDVSSNEAINITVPDKGNFTNQILHIGVDHEEEKKVEVTDELRKNYMVSDTHHSSNLKEEANGDISNVTEHYLGLEVEKDIGLEGAEESSEAVESVISSTEKIRPSKAEEEIELHTNKIDKSTISNETAPAVETKSRSDLQNGKNIENKSEETAESNKRENESENSVLDIDIDKRNYNGNRIESDSAEVADTDSLDGREKIIVEDDNAYSFNKQYLSNEENKNNVTDQVEHGVQYIERTIFGNEANFSVEIKIKDETIYVSSDVRITEDPEILQITFTWPSSQNNLNYTLSVHLNESGHRYVINKMQLNFFEAGTAQDENNTLEGGNFVWSFGDDIRITFSNLDFLRKADHEDEDISDQQTLERQKERIMHMEISLGVLVILIVVVFITYMLVVRRKRRLKEAALGNKSQSP